MSELQRIIELFDKEKNEPDEEHNTLLEMLPEVDECLYLSKELYRDILRNPDTVEMLNQVKFKRLGLLLYKLNT